MRSLTSREAQSGRDGPTKYGSKQSWRILSNRFANSGQGLGMRGEPVVDGSGPQWLTGAGDVSRAAHRPELDASAAGPALRRRLGVRDVIAKAAFDEVARRSGRVRGRVTFVEGGPDA